MEMHVEEIWMAHFRAIVEREARECGSLRGAYRSISTKLAKSEEYIYQLYQQKPKADGTPRAISLPFSRSLARQYADGRPLDWINQPPIDGTKASDTGPSAGAAAVMRDVGWPFKNVSYQRFMALPRPAQAEIDRFLLGMVLAMENGRTPARAQAIEKAKAQARAQRRTKPMGAIKLGQPEAKPTRTVIKLGGSGD